jgi:hypothetical protein
MFLMPNGDYYLWRCELCDSTNQTVWTRVEADELRCVACGKKFSLYRRSHSDPCRDRSMPSANYL